MRTPGVLYRQTGMRGTLWAYLARAGLIAAALMIALMSPRVASAQSNVGAPDAEVPNHVVIAAYAIAAAVDVSTTEYAIGKGIAREANPVMRWAVDRGPVTAGIWKGALHTAIVYWLLDQTRNHPEHRDRTFWVALGLLAAQTYVDAHNARTISLQLGVPVR